MGKFIIKLLVLVIFVVLIILLIFVEGVVNVIFFFIELLNKIEFCGIILSCVW